MANERSARCSRWGSRASTRPRRRLRSAVPAGGRGEWPRGASGLHAYHPSACIGPVDGDLVDRALLAFLDLVRALPQPPGHDERGVAPPMLRSAGDRPGAVSNSPYRGQHGRSVNRRLRLRWFESITCHHLRKRPASCEVSAIRAVCFGSARRPCSLSSTACSRTARPSWPSSMTGTSSPNADHNVGVRPGCAVPSIRARPIAAGHPLVRAGGLPLS